METAYFRVNGKEKKFEEVYNFNDIWEYGMLFKDSAWGEHYKLRHNSYQRDVIDIEANSDEEAINKVREMFEEWNEEFNNENNEE